MTRVLLAAASAVVRAGLEALVASGPGLVVAGQVASLRSLGEAAERLAPDVVLIERDTDDADLVPTLIALGAADAPPAVVVLTDHPGALWAATAGRSSVRAALGREAGAGEIVAAVLGTAAGLVVLPRSVVDGLMPAPTPAPLLVSASDQPLTPREIEILGMLAEGVGNKAIARRLGISDHTVKFHVGSVMTKLDAANRTEAVTLGIRRGLIAL